METYIELINAYLNKTLSETEVSAFENRLKTDAEFNLVYNEHLIILGGIERTGLIQEINQAKQSYLRTKWLKYFGITVGVILLSILAYSLITKSQNVDNPNAAENNTFEFVTDSMKKEDKRKNQIVIDTNLIEVEKPIANTKKEDKAIIIEKQIVDDETSDIKPITTFFFKEPQLIKVNTEEDFKITLREGTKISIPKNSFAIEKTGQPVSGTIDLQISEFYKLSDMLLANLSTKSDDKLLETGGMLYIEARKNGSKLKLKPRKGMKIVFNNKGKQNMQLFKGEKTDDDNINWKLEPQLESIEVDDALIGEVEEADIIMFDEETEVRAFESVEEPPIFPGCEDSSIEERRDCMKSKINKLVNKKFDISIAEDLNFVGKQRIRTSFEIDENGNVGKIEVRAYQKDLAEEIIRVIELMPKLIPGKQDGKAVKVRYSLPITFTVAGSEENNKDLRGNIRGGNRDSTIILRSDKKFQKEIEAKHISDISDSELERYTFSTTNLGWINCDRFVRIKKRKIKYKLKIKDAEGANVKMIFKSRSSVLPSRKANNQYYFGNIPINEDVILLAIKKKEDKLYLGMKEVKTEVVSELDLNFKEVTIAELKAELYKLNKDFN